MEVLLDLGPLSKYTVGLGFWIFGFTVYTVLSPKANLPALGYTVFHTIAVTLTGL